jgi:hypothetical protein
MIISRFDNKIVGNPLVVSIDLLDALILTRKVQLFNKSIF